MPWRTDVGLPAWLRIALFAPVFALAALALLGKGRDRPAENAAVGDAYVLAKPGTAAALWQYRQLKMDSCRWCGRRVDLNRHHIVPQVANPALRDAPENLIVLCRDCHFVLGHRCDWTRYNPDVRYICATFTNCVRSADTRYALTNRAPDAAPIPAAEFPPPEPEPVPPAAYPPPDATPILHVTNDVPDRQKTALERILRCGSRRTEAAPE